MYNETQLILLSTSFLLFITAIILYMQYTSSKSLKGSTTGTIVDITKYQSKFNKVGSKIEGLSFDLETSELHFGKRAPNGTYYLVYSYTVDGVEYKRATLYSTSFYNSKMGKQVVVYYDIDNPEKASLSKGKIFGILSLTSILTCVLLFIISFVF